MGLIVPRCGGDWSVALFLTLAVPELSPSATTCLSQAILGLVQGGN
jgi:hypothetical protein